MSKHYFELTDDVYVPERWDLGTPVDTQGQKLDDWIFTRGESLPIEGRLRIPIRAYDGVVLDYTEAGIKVPVISAKAAAVFSELAADDIRLIPVDVEAHPEPFFVLVCTRAVKCIDEEKSGEVQFWKPEDGFPEKVGTYRAVTLMRIDPAQVGDAQVFRPLGWEVLVVSEDIRQALERVGATGLKFWSVTGPSAISPEERERMRKSRERRERIDTARNAFWRTLGTLDSSIIPIAAGGSWPGHRQVWRVILRSNHHTLLVTDGLSDPFFNHAESSVGFGLELALETDTAMKQVYTRWPTQLLRLVSDEVASHEHVREGVKSGLFSMEVNGKDMPRSLRTSEGRVGVLLGLPSPSLPSHFDMPDGPVQLITVTALLPSELHFLLSHGEQGPTRLAQLFQSSGQPPLSRVRRTPVPGVPR